MWNRLAWLAGAVLALAAFSPLQAQTKNPDCTGVGVFGPGVNKMFCFDTGCGTPPGCKVEATSTAWGANTGRVCRCDFMGPPLNCCRLVLIKFPAGGMGYTTQGQCDFPNCNDWGSCKLGSQIIGGNRVYQAYCLKNGEKPQYGLNFDVVTTENGAFQGFFSDQDADGDGQPDEIPDPLDGGDDEDHE